MQATTKVLGFVDSAFQNGDEDQDFRDDQEENEEDVYGNDLEDNFLNNRMSLNSSIFYRRMNRIIGLLGLMCIILSVLGFSFGISKLSDPPNAGSPHRRAQMYVETNFFVVLLFYAGVDALVKFFTGQFYKRSSIFYSILFLAFGHQISGLLAQIVNLNLSDRETDIFLSITVSISRLVGGPICICLIIVHMKLQEMSYVSAPPDSQVITRKVGYLIIFIFVQLITSFSAGILFLRNEIDHEKSLKISDEIGSSFWVIFSASICLILVTFRRRVNFLDDSALILQFLAVLVSVKPIIIPLETLYIFPNDFSTILLFLNFIIFLVTLVIFCMLFFGGLFPDCPPQLATLIIREWPIYKQTYFWQTAMFVVNSSILIIGFFRHRLYLTNFTPLPFFIILHLVASLKLYKNPNPGYFAMNTIFVILCGVFSFRDIYLFNYHVAKIGANSPDLPMLDNSSDQKSSLKNGLLSENYIIILNVGLVVATLMELLLSISLLASYLRTVFEFFRFYYKSGQISTQKVKICAVCQLLISVFLLIFGFATFLKDSYTAEIYGDHSIYLAIFSVLAAILTIATKNSTNFVPFALICQILAFCQKIQFIDFGAFCLWNLRAGKSDSLYPNLSHQSGRSVHSNAINLATLSFVLMIMECCLELLNVVLLNDIFESGNYGPKPQPFIFS